MPTTRRRFAFLIAFSAATAVSACGGDGVVLPNEGKPAAITIVSGDTQSGPAGAALGAPLVVKVTDALDRPVEGRAVSFTIDAGGGQVAPASVPTGSDGKASANWTLGAATGQQRVQAQVTGSDVPATLLVKFSASAVSGTGSVLEIVSGDNQTAPVRSALADSLVVKVADALGNPVVGVAVQWAALGGGSISPATVVTGADGLAAAERVLGTASGTQTAEASSAGLATVTFTHTAIAANPTTLILVSGDAQSGGVGAPLADSLVVRLEDDNGNGVGGKAITWVVGTGAGSVSPVTSTTSATGFAKTEWTLGASAGSKLVSAVFSGLPSVQFVATAGAGAPAKLAFTQAPVNTRAGATITPSVKVAIQDASGNTVTSAQDAITLAIGTNPAGGALSGTATVAAVNGVATFSDLSIDKAGGGYTLAASSGGLTGATSPAFDILTGSANRLVFVVGPTARVVGQAFSPAIQVQVQDAGGNPVLTASNTITLVSSVTGTLAGTASQTPFLGTATFSNLSVTKAGTGYTLTALSSGLVSATSGAFDVTQGATTITIGTRSPGSSVPGQNVTVNYDINITSPAAGSLTGSVTVSDGTTSCNGGVNAGTGSGSCTLAFPDAGTHQLTATYSGDANFLGSTSAQVPYTVNKAATALTITQDTPDPSLLGDPVTVHWSLTSTGSGTITGNVTLTVSGGAETCSAAAALGAGSCALTLTASGSRGITATYLGDANFIGSSDNEPHDVQGQTSTTVTTSGTPSTAGQSVTFTAHVAVLSGSGSLSGTVLFFDGAAQIGSGGVNGSGNAAISTASLSVGAHSITAAYQGSTATFFAPSTSSALTQNVDPVANVPPTAVDDPSYTMLEDGGTLNVNSGNGVLKNDSDPDSGPQALIARNASTPAHGSVVLASNGSFTYTPNADYNGTDTFTYEAFDGADASTATVTITITAVNDAPSFTKGGDQSASLLGPGQTVSGWATGIGAGPANESSQTVSFDVSTDDDSQFLVTPQVDGATGTLTYTPDPLASGGTVTVTLRAHDNGGTANGGVDVSPNQTFTITLTP